MKMKWYDHDAFQQPIRERDINALFYHRHQAHLEIHVQVFLAMAKRHQEVVVNIGAH